MHIRGLGGICEDILHKTEYSYIMYGYMTPRYIRGRGYVSTFLLSGKMLRIREKIFRMFEYIQAWGNMIQTPH
jgi:hypothetical protein